MDLEKLVTSETSSDETDHQEELQDESTGTKRSYECTFCRRGFTNAQALGGHMNIHRKDRLKAKQNTANSSVQSKFSNEESVASPFVSEIRGQPTGYYSIFEAQKNYNMYFQPSVANPRQPSPYGFQYEFLNQRSHQSLNVNQEILGTNLSLRIGSSHLEADNEVRRGIHEEGEVDLELRLGHDPY